MKVGVDGLSLYVASATGFAPHHDLAALRNESYLVCKGPAIVTEIERTQSHAEDGLVPALRDRLTVTVDPPDGG